MKRNRSEIAVWGRLPMLCALILTASLAFAGSPKMSKDLEGKNASDQVNVIVQFTQAPTAKHHQKVMNKGGKFKQELGLVNGGAYSVPASALADLAADPDVAFISPDRPVQATLDNARATVGADLAYKANWTGKGVGVAVLDSGLSNISEFDMKRVVYSQDFTNGITTIDMYGHGMHVGGIIGGAGNKYDNTPYQHRGIAPGVNLINLKVLNDSGVGTDSGVIAAIDQAINLKKTYNIRVMNLSLGRPVYESYTLDPLDQAVEKAWKAGIVVVVAAGNEGRNNSKNTNGYGTITVPGNDPYVITVGAMNMKGTPSRADDVIASYSSKGPTLYDHVIKPDLVAPGNQVVSVDTTAYGESTSLPYLYPQTIYNSSCPYCYIRISGTSMAAPMVSGAAAILLQKTPSLTPDQVKARLMKTAYKTLPLYTTATDPVTGVTYNSQADIFTVGAGYLDIQAALANTDLAPATAGSALSPTVTKDASGNIVLVNGSSVIWGGSVMWGTSVVWGTSVLWGSNVQGQSVLWGSGVCWGSSTMQGYSVLWGSGVVWGNSSTPAGEATGILINGEN
jgi:serine protease AprX